MAKGILRGMYAKLEEWIDAKAMSGKLFSEDLIDMPEKQQITNAVTTEDGNRILLDHLYRTATKQPLLRFAAILLDDKHNGRVQQLGERLEQALQRLQEDSRCVALWWALLYVLHCFCSVLCFSIATGMDKSQNSEENEELDVSADSMQPSSDIREEESPDDESNTGSEQDEVSG